MSNLNNNIKKQYFNSAQYKKYFKNKGITSHQGVTQKDIAFLSSNRYSMPHQYYNNNRHYYNLDNATLDELYNVLILNIFGKNQSNLSENNLNSIIITNIDDLTYQLKGIYNFGNTCYFNISIQVLLRCTDIVKLLLQNDNIYLKLFIYYYFIDNSSDPINQYATILLLKVLNFPNTQEDPDECILRFLEGGELRSTDINSIISPYILNEIKNILYFKMEVKHETSNQTTITNELILRLPFNSKDFKKIFINYFKNNNIKSIISDLKKYFFIMLNRTNGNGTKNESDVSDIPELLSISIGENFYNYKLIAFNMHFGRSSSSGHYQAFKEINRTWYKFNDYNVEKINFKNYLKKSSILVYELIDNYPRNNYFRLPSSIEELNNTTFINNNSSVNISGSRSILNSASSPTASINSKKKSNNSIQLNNNLTNEEKEIIKEYIIRFAKKLKSKSKTK
jgi:hypothetical protein